MSIESTLRNIPFFQHLSESNLAQLTAVSKRVKLPKGAAVFEEGDDGDGMYVVLEGEVRVTRKGTSGPIELAVLGSQHYFGELSLLDGEPRAAAVTTTTDCELFFLGTEEFMTVLNHSRWMMASVMSALSGKLRGAQDKAFWEMLQKQTLQIEMEKERYRALARLVAGVAHELNTPLGIMTTASSMVTDVFQPDIIEALSKGDPEKEEMLTDAVDAVRLIQGNLAHASRLVQSFKSLSVGQASDTLDTLDLRDLVDEIVTLFSPQAEKALLHVAILDKLERREWRGYPGYLTQILLHLLGNIERYAYPGGRGGEVEIVLEGDGAGVTLGVRDFGVGISQENLPRVFDAFFTTGRSRGGTGLGLSIVHGLVTQALHGSIDIQSEPGVKTEVTVKFPWVIPEQVRI